MLCSHMITFLSVLSAPLSPLLIRTLVTVDESSFSCLHFTVISSLKAPLPNTATIRGTLVKTFTDEFEWGQVTGNSTIQLRIAYIG